MTDFLTPTHGVIENMLDSQMEERLFRTKMDDIIIQFIPLLKSLIRGCRATNFSSDDVHEYTETLVKLNTFFETHDWNKTWRSLPVIKAWRQLWVSNNLKNCISTSKYLD